MRRSYIFRILRYRFASGAFCAADTATTAATMSAIASRILFTLSSLVEQVADQVDDRLRGTVDDRRHLLREPDSLVDGRGLAPDDEHPVDGPLDPDAAGQTVEHPEQRARVHAVCIEGGHAGVGVRDGPVQVVFEQVERAGVVALADGVDEDEGAVAVEQAVGQVHPADADVGDLDAGRQLAPGEPAGHLDAEPVVGEEDVADTCDQDTVPGKDPVHGSSISSGWK
jgi:hypothetical protein